MKIESNFDGDWKEICKYCGKLHEEHKSDLGVYEGVHYLHRTPCKQEQDAIIRKRQKEVLTLKGVMLFGWVLVPLFIAIVGFANFWVGLLLFIIMTAKYQLLFKNTKSVLRGEPGRVFLQPRYAINMWGDMYGYY